MTSAEVRFSSWTVLVAAAAVLLTLRLMHCSCRSLLYRLLVALGGSFRLRQLHSSHVVCGGSGRWPFATVPCGAASFVVWSVVVRSVVVRSVLSTSLYEVRSFATSGRRRMENETLDL